MSDYSDDEEERGPSIGTYDGGRHPETNARHGKGRAVLPNGDIYEGEYIDGQRHGEGVYRFKNGARYVGQYELNKKNGQGTFYYPDGSKYEGSFSDDLRSGQGVYTYPNGDTYDGEWVNGVREGEGTFTYASAGVKFRGSWVKGIRVGEGTLMYPGMEFRGTFTDDQPLGAGKFVFDSGYEQSGEYVLAEASDEAEDDKPALKWHGETVKAS
eukprot:m.355345 g.355345  ORF g.355345 m.355345 type:complete len:212 (-) comp17227_c0_seq1:241-876(-)